MKHTANSIEKILDDYMSASLESKTKEEVLEALSVYHEELRVQNMELMRINERLEAVKNEYEQLFLRSPIGYLLIDEVGLILRANDQAKLILCDNDLTHSVIHKHFSDESQDKLYLFLRSIREFKITNKVELETRTGDDQKHIKMVGDYIEYENNPPVIQLALLDETQEFRFRSQVEYLSMHDQLTGLYNRRFLEEEIRRLDVDRSLPIGIIIADLNGLKLVNDAFGHQSGDILLVETAKKLKHELRQEDIIARTGGDEFVILLSNTSERELHGIIERIDRACSNVGLLDIRLSVSFGFCTKTKPEQSIQKIMRTAEDRMYKDKLFKHTSQRKEIINGILSTLHEKNKREEAHSKRVSYLAELLAKEIKMDESAVIKIKTAGLLHDIGKIAIDYSILDKNGTLTPKEYAEIKKHSEIGYRILKQSSEFGEIADIILSHHERIDGKGYPRGIMGNEIRIESKILAICDAFDA
jgi:diguanylate cyclase (GGDEF)-like protein/putative nucleotidyltransferase with HDIG domain